MIKKSSQNLLLLGVGIAAGWVMKQLFDSPEGKEKREQVVTTMGELRQRFETSDEGARLKKIFGSAAKELTVFYQQAREQVIKEVAALDLPLDQIDKAKYQKIVTSIITAITADGKLPKTQVTKLKDTLLSDFSKLKTVTKTTVKKKVSQKTATKRKRKK